MGAVPRRQFPLKSSPRLGTGAASMLQETALEALQ